MKKGKGIVLQVESDAMLLLGRDGSFQRVPLAHPLPLLGEEIEYVVEEAEEPTSKETGLRRLFREGASPVLRYGWIALLLLILSGLFFFLPLRPEASYIVALDINPNLELYVDAGDRVQAVRSYGKETKDFLKGLSLTGKEITSAVREITEKATREGYLKAPSSSVIATVIPFGGMQNKEEILQKVDLALKSFETKEQVVLTSTDRKRLEEAHSRNLPVYKYAVLHYIEKKGSKVTEEEMNASTNALMKEFNIHLEDLLRASDILHVESPPAGPPASIPQQGPPEKDGDQKGEDQSTPAHPTEDEPSEQKGVNRSLPANRAEDPSIAVDQNQNPPSGLLPALEDMKGATEGDRWRQSGSEGERITGLHLNIGGLGDLLKKILEGLTGQGDRQPPFVGSIDGSEQEKSGTPSGDQMGNKKRNEAPPKDQTGRKEKSGNSTKDHGNEEKDRQSLGNRGVEERHHKGGRPSSPNPDQKDGGLSPSSSILDEKGEGANLSASIPSVGEEGANLSLSIPAAGKEEESSLSLSVSAGKEEGLSISLSIGGKEEGLSLSLSLLGGGD